MVLIAGEITTTAWVDMPQIVRNTVKEIGYNSSEMGFDSQSCGVLDGIKEQSTDIDMGVSQSQELKTGSGVDELNKVGVKTARGCEFTLVTLQRILARLDLSTVYS